MGASQCGKCRGSRGNVVAFGYDKEDGLPKTTKGFAVQHGGLSFDKENKVSRRLQETNYLADIDQNIWTVSYDDAYVVMGQAELEEIAYAFQESLNKLTTNNAKKSIYEEANMGKATISREIFLGVFVDHCFGSVGKQLPVHLFSHLAGSENGKLGYRALVSAVYMWRKGTMLDRLVLLFDMFDKYPRKGYLSRSNIKELVHAISKRRTDSASGMMRALKLDGAVAWRRPKNSRTHSGLVTPFTQARLAATTSGGDIWKLEEHEEEQKEKERDEGKSSHEKWQVHVSDADANDSEKLKNRFLSIPGGKGALPPLSGGGEWDVVNFESLNQKLKVDADNLVSLLTPRAGKRCADSDKYGSHVNQELDLFIDKIFEDMDPDVYGQISVKEWLYFASGDRDIDEFLEHFVLAI
eukprot:CAMPEP_0197540862 /NCGR_PEP_ID=MMETSP1318-20131121/66837_1 /TAXON_ID=552666 /ORGANISM="Partenskyella glossopodia, Strain RCC365" /LENGTH=409 /DNA_ID=CAMNT_0043099969 /DNA_START=90 /DNA_END=1319 /DNA_ORIENTATION=-